MTFQNSCVLPIKAEERTLSYKEQKGNVLLKRTFVTRLPDRAGSLLPITECLDRYGLTITRISYNRAVDTRMLFLETEGNEESLDAAEKKLTEEGCLSNDESPGSVVLMAFALPERPGMLLPVLRLVHRFGFNISYISLRREKDEPLLLQMGLFADKSKVFSEFLRRASLYCPVQILDYDNSNKILDDTVFCLSFARSIAEKARLLPKESRCLLINANRIMQVLDEQNRSPYKTFDTIGQFADFLVSHEGMPTVPALPRLTARVCWFPASPSGIKLWLPPSALRQQQLCSPTGREAYCR